MSYCAGVSAQRVPAVAKKIKYWRKVRKITPDVFYYNLEISLYKTDVQFII